MDALREVSKMLVSTDRSRETINTKRKPQVSFFALNILTLFRRCCTNADHIGWLWTLESMVTREKQHFSKIRRIVNSRYLR